MKYLSKRRKKRKWLLDNKSER